MRALLAILVVCAAGACGTNDDLTLRPPEAEDTPPTPGPPRPGPPRPGPPPPSTLVATVRVERSSFVPFTLTVRVGDTVRWTWIEGDHSVTSGPFCTPDGRFDSGVLAPPAEYRFTFDEPGEYPYFDQGLCGVGMMGTVIVEP